MASQSAGQCGPCALGLPALAASVEHMAKQPDRNRTTETAIHHGMEMIVGRGACKLPDGAARFVSSGLTVFAEHITEHAVRGPCAAFSRPAVLPVPRPEASWR